VSLHLNEKRMLWRVRGTFKVYNEKETTSSEFGYVIYSGEMLGAKGIQRPALPEKLEGSVCTLTRRDT